MGHQYQALFIVPSQSTLTYIVDKMAVIQSSPIGMTGKYLDGLSVRHLQVHDFNLLIGGSLHAIMDICLNQDDILVRGVASRSYIAFSVVLICLFLPQR